MSERDKGGNNKMILYLNTHIYVLKCCCCCFIYRGIYIIFYYMLYIMFYIFMYLDDDGSSEHILYYVLTHFVHIIHTVGKIGGGLVDGVWFLCCEKT